MKRLDKFDFIFRNGIDWQAFMISFDKLREKIRVESEDAEISIQSIANKGDGVFVIKVNVPLDADKAEIHSTLTKEYDMNLRLIEAKYQTQLEAKDKEIGFYREKSTDFKEIITVLASNIRTSMISDSRYKSRPDNQNFPDVSSFRHSCFSIRIFQKCCES